MSEKSEEILQRRSEQILQPSTPIVTAGGSKQPRIDQVCVYTSVDDEGIHCRLAFVIEDKPAHKLTLANLRMGLRPLDLRKDVIDRIMVPTSEDQVAHFQYHSDRLVAAVITQIFSYMIEGGVQYGYITTGEAIVFLHAPSEDPSTIRYHLAEPRADVEAQIEAYPGEDYSHRTALGQVLAFNLVALESKSNTNKWRQSAMGQLTPWEVDYDAILHEIPASIRKTAPTSSYCPRPYRLVDRSPIKLRSMTASGCRPQRATTSLEDDSSSESETGLDPPKTPTRAPGAGPSHPP